MTGNQKLIVIGLVTVAIAAGVWKFFERRPVIPEQPTPPKVTGCTRPPSLAQVDDRKLKLAATQVGNIAVGEVNLENKTAVVDLLSEQADKMLVFDYLMCEARARGEYDPSDPAQADRVRIVAAFLATNPTAEQFIKLQELLKPEKPQARLVVPELANVDGKQVLVITEPVQTISLSNAGEDEMLAWVRNESPGRLMVSPREPATIPRRKHATVQIGLVSPADSGPWTLRVGSSAAQDETEVEVRVQAAAKVAELLEEVAKELQSKVGDAPGPSQASGGSETTAATSAAGAQWLAERARDVVKRSYPDVSDELAWATAGSLLEQMNWNAPAVAAYRASRVSLGAEAHELDLPLSRAQVLANVPADPARKERVPADVLGSEDLARLSSLQLARGNALVTGRPELARSLSAALMNTPSLAPFAQGLKGDVALASNSPEAAIAAYDACATLNAAPSCTLRKAEAQVAMQDFPAANATLAQVPAQTPAGTQAVTRRIAVDAANVAATTSVQR